MFIKTTLTKVDIFELSEILHKWREIIIDKRKTSLSIEDMLILSLYKYVKKL